MVTFASPGPAEPGDELLYDSRPEFRQQLRTVVDHVVASAMTPGRRGLTFGVYGAWGAGKSSALRVLRRELTKCGDQKGVAFTFTEYEAPAWETFNDARTSLAYGILQSLDASTLPHVQEALAGVMSHPLTAALPETADLARAIGFFRALVACPESPVVEHWIQQRVRQALAGPAPKAHVVFLDDVDRCGPSYTAALLIAMNAWDHVPDLPLFFFVAASRDHLLEALEEQALGSRTAEEAIEKYVHVDLEVPDFLTTPSEVATYQTGLATTVARSQGEADLLKQLLDEAALQPADSVLAPLVRLGSARLTPRRAKDRLNALLIEFQPTHVELDDDLRRDIKIWVIRTFWPNFWTYTLAPLLKGGPSEEWEDLRAYVTTLRDYGRLLLPLWNAEDDQLRSAQAAVAIMLERTPARGYADAPVRLAMYLSMSPPWQPPPDAVFESLTSSPPRAPTDENVDTVESDPQTQTHLLYLQAEAASDAGDHVSATTALVSFANIVRANPAAASASRIGNAALVAQRIGSYDLARDLHRRAVQRDPHHWNVVQNYVDFIVGRGLEADYDIAREQLARLADEGADHKPTRTAALALQLDGLTGASVREVARRTQEFATSLRANPNFEGFLRASELFPKYVDESVLTEITKAVAQAVEDDERLHLILRGYADTLARSNEGADELLAIDVYRFLLSSGLACQGASSDTSDLRHNLASLLSTQGFRANAIAIWRQIYRERPYDGQVRRGLAVALENASQEAAAAAVLQGKELPELPLTPQKLPSPFSDRPHWWRNLVSNSYAPCLPGLDGNGDS